MDYKIVLDTYEGPMDLLLDLIEKAKIDIYDIPINLITEQYLDYIDRMGRFDLEVTSDFLVMAATLLEIKSKLLLPKPTEGDEEEEEDPREELARRLIAYKRFKAIASELRKYESLGLKAFYKPQEDLSQFLEEELDIGPFDVDLLFNTLNRILDRRGLKSEDLVLDEISRDEFTIEECTENLLKRLEACKRMSFSNLLGKDSTRNEIISYFYPCLS